MNDPLGINHFITPIVVAWQRFKEGAVAAFFILLVFAIVITLVATVFPGRAHAEDVPRELRATQAIAAVKANKGTRYTETAGGYADSYGVQVKIWDHPFTSCGAVIDVNVAEFMVNQAPETFAIASIHIVVHTDDTSIVLMDLNGDGTVDQLENSTDAPSSRQSTFDKGIACAIALHH